MRHAPGLSLKFRGRLPPQQALYTDGDRPLVLYEARTPDAFQFARYTLPFAAMSPRQRPPGSWWSPRAAGRPWPAPWPPGSNRITIAEPNRHLARALERHYGLPVVRQPARNFLAASDQRYDIIQVDNWGPSCRGPAPWTNTAI